MIGLLSNLSTSFVVNINFRYDTWKGAKDTRKAHFKKAFSEKAQIKIKWKSPPKHRTGSIRNHGKDQGPETNRPGERSVQGCPPMVRPLLVMGAPPWRQLGPTFFRQLHSDIHSTVSPTTKFKSPRTVLWSYKLRPPLLHLNISRYKKIEEGVVLY